MGARKRISLGNGQYILANYEELKAKLIAKKVASGQANKLLRRNFPEELAAEQNFSCLFDAEVVQSQRWSRYLDSSISGDTLSEYWVSHDSLVAMAKHFHAQPLNQKRQNRVTDFTSWIYEVIHRRDDPSGKANGKVGEREVAKIKRFRPQSDFGSDWRLIAIDPLNDKPKGLEISSLKIDGQSLYGAPDYVFENKKTNTIIIVEVKVTNRTLPSDGWPNLRAQLWAYAHIDSLVERASNIILIGEVWRRIYIDITRAKQYELCHTYRWTMSDLQFCKRNEELFEQYKNFLLHSRIERI